MATAINKPCHKAGCGAYSVKRGYCSAHQSSVAAYDQHRGTSTQRGYGHKWRKARREFLDLNGLCVHCLASGQVVVASVVDHITPHKGNDKLFWSRSNWQALCESCHNRKTATTDGGAWGGGRKSPQLSGQKDRP